MIKTCSMRCNALSSAKSGGAGIGPTMRAKAMKIVVIMDRHSLPLASIHADNHHEITLA